MTARRTFEELVAEGASEPVAGWDFSWFAGRATEERPRWGYSGLLAAAIGAAGAVLDIQTGGGEVLAASAGGVPPPVLAATESWPPNVALARRRLEPLGGTVTEAADDAPLPFGDAVFDLVASRHPTRTGWPEIARVLRPGGRYLSQQVGAGSNRELYEYLMGPQPASPDRSAGSAAGQARAAGLVVTRLESQALRVEFFDIGAVVYFLRKVLWTVPDFSVARYRGRLAALHAQIEADGRFTCHSQRFLIEARRRPAPDSGRGGVYAPRAGAARDWFSQERSAPTGAAPVCRAITWPSRKTISVGIDWIPNRCWRPGALSTLTLTSLSLPGASAASCSSAGLTVRHGPHHGAQKSTSTGTDAPCTRSAKFASPASTTHGSAAWQLPHFVVPAASPRTRLRRPQLGHLVISSAMFLPSRLARAGATLCTGP